MSKAEIEIENNGYEEFLADQIAKGVPIDAFKAADGGIGLIQPPEEKHTNAALLGSVPGAQSLYEKGNKDKGILLDLMARTFFRNNNEMIYFLDWCEWCEDFGVGLDGPMRYSVAVTSQGGLSREQYVEAITTQRFKSYGGNNGGNKSGFRAKPQDGVLP